jgi:hypothetical protein
MQYAFCSLLSDLEQCAYGSRSALAGYFYVEPLGCVNCGSPLYPCTSQHDDDGQPYAYQSKQVSCSQYSPVYTFYSGPDCLGDIVATVPYEDYLPCGAARSPEYSVNGFQSYYCNATVALTSTGPTLFPTTAPSVSPTYAPGQPTPYPIPLPTVAPTVNPTASPTSKPLYFVTQYTFAPGTSCDDANYATKQESLQLDVCWPYASTTYPTVKFVKVTGNVFIHNVLICSFSCHIFVEVYIYKYIYICGCVFTYL